MTSTGKDHKEILYDKPKLVPPPVEVKKQKKNYPPFVAPENRLENVGNYILTNLDQADTSDKWRVPPMALISCPRGRKTQALCGTADWLKKMDGKLAVIFVCLNAFSFSRIDEGKNTTAGLRRIRQDKDKTFQTQSSCANLSLR